MILLLTFFPPFGADALSPSPTRETLNGFYTVMLEPPPDFHKGGGTLICAFTSPPLVAPAPWFLLRQGQP